MQQISLTNGWSFKQRQPEQALATQFTDLNGWLPATVPGTTHQDLITNNVISDPFIGMNEHDVQWVGEVDWLYHTTFTLDTLSAETVELCMDGLDTFATVWLNGTEILTSDNMFVPYRVEVTPLLKQGDNDLQILFESAWMRGRALQESFGNAFAVNGDISRAQVRKAQYHYGWDWGPTLMTAGIWRDIRLEAYESRIADVHCVTNLTNDLSSAEVSVTVETAGAKPDSIKIVLYDPQNNAIDETSLFGDETHYRFTVTNPRLWWPRGYGEAALYRVEVTLTSANDNQADQKAMRIGIRSLMLVQEPLEDEPGQTFYFKINNTPIFCGGANWIPADSYLPAITSDRYRRWIQLAADANMQMLRVWGGGIYEDDVFYDICDELGIMVWQDFMFACAIYPTRDEFLANVRREAEANVRRLRNHPSIVIWCGNNEDYLVPGWYQNIVGKPADFNSWVIYENVLPEVCEDLDPSRPYWRGSPYTGDGKTPNEATSGDRHTWEIWHGTYMQYQNYPKFWGRFVSEFGMQSAPRLDLIETFTEPQDRYPESRVMDQHNKATGFADRIGGYLAANLRGVKTLEEYIYATQLIQAEALKVAYSTWRRRWGGPGRYAVAGALVWQINDCWPVTSWAIVDYTLYPKPAYFTIRRELDTFSLGMRHEHGQAHIWAVNTSREAVDAQLNIFTYTLDGQQVGTETKQVTLLPNQSTELDHFSYDVETGQVVFARLQVKDEIVAREALWPEPFKYFQFPEPELKIERTNNDTLRIQSKRPAKGVWLSAGNQTLWSDNMLDLMPNEIRLISVPGISSTPIEALWLGAEKSRLY